MKGLNFRSKFHFVIVKFYVSSAKRKCETITLRLPLNQNIFLFFQPLHSSSFLLVTLFSQIYPCPLVFLSSVTLLNTHLFFYLSKPFFVNYSRVQVLHGYPNTVERGQVIYQDGYTMQALLHFYCLNDPSAASAVQWHQFVAGDASNHFLKVLGIRYNTEQDLGYSHLIVFTENSDSTLFQWSSMNQLHVQYYSGCFNYLSNSCSSKLRYQLSLYLSLIGLICVKTNTTLILLT